MIELAAFREMLKTELPHVLREYPDARHELWGLMLDAFPSREEFTTLLRELREMREESNRRFEEIDRRFEEQAAETRALREDANRRFEEQAAETRALREDANRRFDDVNQRMEAGFNRLERSIDRLGARWGIRSESVFRQTMASLLEQSFGVRVQSLVLRDEQFDVVISNGTHILVEIAASADRKIQERLEHKRRLYAEVTGVAPARVILATASIHSHRAQALRDAGFEVIEPEEEGAD